MKILVGDPTIAAVLPALQSALPPDVTWQVCETATESEIVAKISDAAIYVGGSFTRAMAEAARALQLIQVPGAGLDQITFEVLPPGVVVANTFHHERSIAEYVVMVMLALSRRLRQADANLRRGIWHADSGEEQEALRYRALAGQTVGLVGFGHIGREVARLISAFGMTVLAIKRTPDPAQAARAGIALLGGPRDLPELLARSDFLVLAAPLTPATRGWLGARELGLLKPSAFLVNVSRAELVEEEALYRALAEHRIAGAALDVWYQYPEHTEAPTLPAHLPFHLLANVILTPHYSGATRETRDGRIADVTYNLKSWLERKPLRNLVSPHSDPVS